MKRLYFNLSAIILTMILMLSCSSDGGKISGLLSRIPESADVVLIGNLNTVIESFGGSVKDSEIKLPNYIADLMGSEGEESLDELDSFLKKSGLDIDVCGLFIFSYQNSNNPIAVFSLSDNKKFISALEEEDFSKGDKEGELTLYISDDDDYCVAVGGDYGYFCNNKRRALEALADAVEGLKDGSYADTPMGSYISKGNAVGLALRIPKRGEFRELENLPFPIGGICMYGDLEGDVLSLTAKVVDNDGNDIKDDKFSKYMNTNARVNSDALAFLGEDECLALASSIKDFKWDELFDMIEKNGGLSRSDRANLNTVKSYLEMIDGTIAIGLGVTDGLSSFSKLAAQKDVMSELSFTVVVETKEGKAKSLLSDLMGLMEEFNVPFEETADGFQISEPSLGSLYAQSSGDMLVFSNHAISKDNNCEVVKQVKFSDHLGGVALVLTQANKLMKDLGLSNDIKATAFSDGKMEGKFTLEISGGNSEGGVLAKMVQIGLSLYQNSDSIMSYFQKESYYDYDDYDDLDYAEEEAPFDSAAWADEW